MIAGPAMRSRPVCHGVAARARRQRAVRSSAPMPAAAPRQPDEDQRDDGEARRRATAARCSASGHRGHAEQDPEDDGDHAAAQPAQRAGLVRGQGRAGVRVVGGREHAAMLSAAARLRRTT